MNKIFNTLLHKWLLLSIVFVGVYSYADAQIQLKESQHKIIIPNLPSLYSPCSTKNSIPVSHCYDWMTGPASDENSQVQMYYGDRNKKPWKQSTLTETDIGLPVMDPNGKQLELMVYGDTYAANPNFTLKDHKKEVAKCMKKTQATICGNNKDCNEIFNTVSPKANACTYYHAHKRNLMVFDKENNVVMFDAEIDASRTYRIKFKKHLYQKMVRHGAQEGVDSFGNQYFTGVYVIDYFYTCPGSTTVCADKDKLLHFITSTIFWQPTKGNPSNEQILYARLGREGIGFYKFGPLNTKGDTAPGCRIRYGPSYAKTPTVKDYSCLGSTTKWLQPQHTHTTKSKSYTVKKPANVHIYWGKGSKFNQAIVAHGFNDPYHTGNPPSQRYVYFIGSGETDVNNKPSGKIYLSRLLASETALLKAQFEYFKGMSKSRSSEWGSYQEAQSIYSTEDYFLSGPPLASSFTKRFGKYYMAATCYYNLNIIPNHGMCIFSSKDGFTWQDPDFALYCEIGTSAKNVYGHIWVPEFIYSSPDGIAYIFSVWKSRKGYFKDFFRNGDPTVNIKAEDLFYRYNTKMFLYRPKK